MSNHILWTLATLSFISAAIGWFTNWVAVKMLLHPIHPIKILGYNWQGLLPKRQAELAEQIAEAIAKEFLTEADIIGFLQKVDASEAIKQLIRSKWDLKIDDILSVIPMIKMFLSKDKLDSIRDKIIEAFSDDDEEFVQFLSQSLTGKIDLQKTLARNIAAFEIERLQAIIENIAKKEFRDIELLGGVLGFIIGLVQAIIVLWVLPHFG